MNGDAPEGAPWTRRRWAGVVLAVFASHLAVLGLVSPRREAVQRPAAAPAAVRWLTDPVRARKALDALLLEDPTLLAMASTRGFSGPAWLRPQRAEYNVSEWTDTERSLAQPTQSLGGAFRLVAPAGPQPVFDATRKPAAPVPGVTVRQPALRTASRLRIEGPVGSRPLVQVPVLRSWAYAGVLEDSRVQVLVSDEGLVFSPRRASASGVRPPAQHAADQHALELARMLRFAPAPKSAAVRGRTLVEGTLVFQWHTVEPPADAKAR